MKKLIIANAIAYLLSILIGHNDAGFYLAQTLIAIINMIVIFKLAKKGELSILFFFFVVTMAFKPFYFMNSYSKSIPAIDVFTAVMLTLIALIVPFEEKA